MVGDVNCDETHGRLMGKDMLNSLKHAVCFPKFYRNYYALPVYSPRKSEWEILVGLKLAYEGESDTAGGFQYYHVTEIGLAMLRKTAQMEEKSREMAAGDQDAH